MIRFIMIIWCICLCFVTLVLADQQAEVLRVVQGQSRILNLDQISQVAIGDGDLANVRVLDSKRELMITGLREGMTTLTIWQKSTKIEYLLRILENDPRLVADDLTEILADVPNIQVRVVGERVLMDGQVDRQHDFKKVKQIEELYPDVLNFVEAPNVELERMVRIQIMLIDIDQSDIKEIGVAWPDVLAATTELSLDSLAGAIAGSISVSAELVAALNLLVSKGNGRMLANPVLVTKHGEEAEFFAGGQIPVPVNEALGQTSIEWKSFGVRVKVLPHVDDHQNFNLQLDLEVSDLDYGNAIRSDAGTVPALKRRTSTAVVNLAQGESLTLAELIDHREGKVVDQVPGISKIPFIGELFRSRSLTKRNSEVYMIITPELIVPGKIDHTSIQEKQMRYQETEINIRPRLIE